MKRCCRRIACVAGNTGVKQAHAAKMCDLIHVPEMAEFSAPFVAPDQMARKKLSVLSDKAGSNFCNLLWRVIPAKEGRKTCFREHQVGLR